MSDQIESLLSAAKTARKLLSFIKGNDFTTVVRSVAGDDAMDAATLALETKSNYPQARLDSAINHLESAYVSYSNYHKSIKNYYALRARESQFYRTERKILTVCALIAACYFVQDDFSASRQYLERGMDSIKRSRKVSGADNPVRQFLSQTRLDPIAETTSLGNLGSTDDTVRVLLGTDGYMHRSQYDEFYASMKSLLR